MSTLLNGSIDRLLYKHTQHRSRVQMLFIWTIIRNRDHPVLVRLESIANIRRRKIRVLMLPHPVETTAIATLVLVFKPRTPRGCRPFNSL